MADTLPPLCERPLAPGLWLRPLTLPEAIDYKADIHDGSRVVAWVRRVDNDAKDRLQYMVRIWGMCDWARPLFRRAYTTPEGARQALQREAVRLLVGRTYADHELGPVAYRERMASRAATADA